MYFFFSEADKEIVVLSRQWNWPVMSNDSDFFIFDIPAGFIPLSHIDYTEPNLVSVRMYHRTKLAEHLEIEEALLPLVASLIGNDYVTNEMLQPLYQALEIGDNQDFPAKLNAFHRRLPRSATVEEAVRSILGIISNQNEKDALKKAIHESLDEYNIYNIAVCDLTCQLETTIGDNIPNYVIKRYRQGQFPVWYLPIGRTVERQILKCQVEDMSQISSNNCSKTLRRIIYGITSPESQGIVEWDREGCDLQPSTVTPLVMSEVHQVPNLENLQELDANQRRNLFHKILESNKAIQSLPEAHQLFAASIRYWIRHARPEVSEEYIKVLLLQFQQNKKSLLDPRKTEWQGIDVALLHSLAQWQSVMAETLCVNKILVDALPEPDLSTIFNGVTAQIIYRELQKGKSIDLLLILCDLIKYTTRLSAYGG